MQGRSTPVRRRGIAVALALLVPLALSSNPSAAVEPGTDPPPVVTSVQVMPSSLPASGGPVTISVQAHDDLGGITQVYADVASWEGTYLSTGLLFDGSGFSGSVQIPPNFGEYEIGYSVTVYVHDVNTFTEATAGLSVEGTPAFDEPPLVWDPSVAPTALPSTGGPVALSVSAFDVRGITAAEALVTHPDGTITAVPMEPIDRADRFHGTFTAPANSTAGAQTHTVQMTAYDDIGQWSAVEAASVTVAGRPALVPGTLSLSPGRRTFGKAVLGAVERKTIVLRRSRSSSRVPMTGFVTASGAGFSLVGAGPSGVPFSLLPGQRKTITVEFRPTAVGAQQGTVRVLRADGRQATLVATLTGRGAAPKR